MILARASFKGQGMVKLCSRYKLSYTWAVLLETDSCWQREFCVFGKYENTSYIPFSAPVEFTAQLSATAP